MELIKSKKRLNTIIIVETDRTLLLSFIKIIV